MKFSDVFCSCYFAHVLMMATNCGSPSNIGDSFSPAGLKTRGLLYNTHVFIVDLLTCTSGKLSFFLNISIISSSLCLAFFSILPCCIFFLAVGRCYLVHHFNSCCFKFSSNTLCFYFWFSPHFTCVC